MTGTLVKALYLVEQDVTKFIYLAEVKLALENAKHQAPKANQARPCASQAGMRTRRLHMPDVRRYVARRQER